MTKKSRTGAVSWDDEGTWPRGLVAKLERQRQAEAPREKLRVTVETAMVGAKVIGYHATRLAPDEVETIKAEGMRPTGRELAAARLERQVASGGLSRSLADLLSEKSWAEHNGGAHAKRKNQIWLCLSRGLLREETGMWRLFSYWGGEMLFAPHSEDVRNELRGIGTACIVELEVAISRLQRPEDFMADLVTGFLARRAGQSKTAGEDYVIGPIEACGVRRTIQRSAPEFEELTGCDEWEDPIT